MPAGPSPDLTFEIAYEAPGDSSHNPDLKGTGTLRIDPAGPVYFFSGRRRAMFAGKPGTCEIRADEIRNVTIHGRRLAFHTQRGNAGATGRLFAFFCRDAGEARSIAALLPRTVDEDFMAVRDFSTRLHTLTDSASSWTSVTNIIVGLNVAVFILMGFLGAGWIQVASMKPYILYGANQGALTTDGEWWRLLTSMFMHYGILHLLFNMWALYQAGHFLEKLLGRLPYALTYLGSGLAGGFASIAWHTDPIWSAGASGAVFGVYGAIVGYLLREKQGLPKSIYQSLLKSSLTFAGYNILFGAANSSIDNSAHLGGVLGGVALGWLVALPVDRAIRREKTGRKLLVGTAAVLAIILAGVSLAPRFDYSAREQWTWDEANRPFASAEGQLLTENHAALVKAEKGEGIAAYAEWIGTRVVPFYRSWDEALAQLKLKPGKSTAAARAQLREIVQRRIDAYSHLAAGLKSDDPRVLIRYMEEENNIAKAISRFEADSR